MPGRANPVLTLYLTCSPTVVRTAGVKTTRSFVAEDRADAAILRDNRVDAGAEQVQIERLVGLLLVVALDLDRDGLRRLTGEERQRAGFGRVVVVARLGGAVHGGERHRHGLIVGARERDCKCEQGGLV